MRGAVAVRFLLDTNTVSHLLQARPGVCQRVTQMPMESLCISAVTEGELLFGIAKRPDARALHDLVGEFLRRVDVEPWDRAAASRYGALRAELSGQGKALAALDLMIAAHALNLDATLVSNDQAFNQVDGLRLEDWSR
jgi:tRNA(fMet)-specific endonuclease VapC